MTLRRPPGHIIVTIMVLLFGAVLVRTAGICDDAYLTFRTVDNFINGYGLRWNVSERVQIFTHPLWMFLHVPVYLVANEIFYSGMFLSMALSMSAIIFFSFRVARSHASAILGLTVLVFSRAFMDFSTSGLENPLTHLLLALFFLLPQER